MLYKTILLALLGLPLWVNAQVKVSGVVVGDDQVPLPGVSVMIKKSSTGTVTNDEGNFSMNARVNDTLVFSATGYLTYYMRVAGAKPMKILLKKISQDMDEVIVIGYGSVKKEDVTGAVGKVNVADLNKAPVVSFDQALAGRVAGVQVTSNDAQPGASMNIVIRGANSLTQDNSPLYVVDGFPVEGFDNASINPTDIVSVNILKDASATAIYGARAANGVIIIETKRGTAGKTAVTYDGSFGFQRTAKTINMMSPYEFVNYQLESDFYRNNDNNQMALLTGPGLTKEDYRGLAPINWQDLLLETAPMTLQNISMSGGAGKTRFFLSGSYNDQKGVITNSGYQKYQGRMRIDQTVSNKLKVGLNLNYAYDKNSGQIAAEQQLGARYFTYLMYQVWAFRPVNVGAANIIEELFDDESSSNAIMNPVISVKNQIRQQANKNLLANINLDYSITNRLRLNIRGGLNDRAILLQEFNNSSTYKGFPSPNNLNGVNGAYRRQGIFNWVNENMLVYQNNVGKNDRIDITGGVTLNGTKTSVFGYQVNNVPNERLGLSGMDQGTPYGTVSTLSENTLVSFLGRVNYNLGSRFLLTATYRADGSSRFSKSNRWAYFPSGAVAWNMHNEKFMKGAGFISGSKLRFSYGVTGNNRVADLARFRSGDIGSFYSFDDGIPGYALNINSLGNEDLKWETTVQFDLGYDLSLFGNRLSLTVDAYRKTTDDLLLNASLPYSTGTTTIYKNIGKVRNEGLEFTLNTVNVKRKSFSWESNFNISFNKSSVLALSEDQDVLLSAVPWTGDWNASHLYFTGIGRATSAFFGYVWDGNYQMDDFTWQNNSDPSIPFENRTFALKTNVPSNGDSRSNIRPGDIKYVDQNNDGMINALDRVVIGNPIPKHIGGLNNNFTYKDLSLNVFFQWSYGNDIYNANRLIFEGNPNKLMINQYASYNKRWTPENQTNDMPKTSSGGILGAYSSRVVEDGSYLRLKTVQLAYALPYQWVKKISGQSAQFYLAAQNLYTWTKYSGMDPEVSVRHSVLTPGFDYSAYPRSRTITLGLKLIL